MNWIDKIFKDQLGSRKFPDELRNKGKADLEFLLAKEMPVAATKAGRGGLFYGGLSVLLIAVIGIPAGIWYFQQGENAEVNPQEYTLNFGQGSSVADAFVVENSVGSSGSWNVGAANAAEPRKMESEEISVVTEDKKASVKTEAENTFELTNDKSLTARSSDRNANKTVVKSNEGNTAVAKTNNQQDRKSVSQNINDADKVAGLEEDQDSKTRAADPSDKRVTDEVPIVASEANVTSQQTSTKAVTNDDSAKSKDTNNKVVDQNSKTKSDASVTVTESKEDGAEKPLETTVAVHADAEETVDPIENNKQTVADAENNSSSVKEESSSQPEENKGLALALASASASAPTSKLQLSNLAFSDMGSGASTDLSQYKSFSPKRMAISLWAGYTYVGKTINGGTPDYLDLRKEKEDAIWTVPTGLTFDYYLTNKWTLSVGAGFSEYGEVLNYDYEYERKGYEDGRYGSPKNYNGITRLDSVRVITNINEGHWEYYFDYTESDTVIKNNNGQTHWSYVEIPIMVGYRFGSGKLKPWVQLGASVGIPYNQTFRYISPSGDGLQTSEESQASASDLQFSGVLNIGLDYYLSRHFSLRLNAVGSYQLSPVYQFNSIKQNYYRLGGTIGVAYNF